MPLAAGTRWEILAPLRAGGRAEWGRATATGIGESRSIPAHKVIGRPLRCASLSFVSRQTVD